MRTFSVLLFLTILLPISTTIDETEEELGASLDRDKLEIKKERLDVREERKDSKVISGEFEDNDMLDGDNPMIDDDIPMEEMSTDKEDQGLNDVADIEPLDFTTPILRDFFYFADPFQDTLGIGKKWHISKAKKDSVDENIAKYDGEWTIGLPTNILLKNDYGLIVKSKAKHHAIAAKLDRPVKFDGNPVVVQYEVKYEQGQECGGGYLKLLSVGAEKDLSNFQDKTPYSIMFGPDKCGMTSKLHFIIRYENPKNHTISEYHSKHSSKSMDTYFNDHKSHLYTLIITPDHSYEILIDQKDHVSGNMLKDMEPSLTPPEEIFDPNEKKPENWDDNEKIVDSEAVKPDDWDEEAPNEILDPDATKPTDWLDSEEIEIADPEAKKPDDWDVEIDGQWEAPMISWEISNENPKCIGIGGCGKWTPNLIPNPAYKGKWKAPKIPNPNYKGKWQASLVRNPHYFQPEPYKLAPITAIGLELWTMSDGILFDNFLITNDRQVAENFAAITWKIKADRENLAAKKAVGNNGNDGLFDRLISTTEDRPWLWAIYILTVLIPIVLISVFCFGGFKDKRGKVKKSDEIQPDDLLKEDDEDEEGEKGEESGQKQADIEINSTEHKSQGKAALEEKDEENASGMHDSPDRLRQRRQD